MFGAIVGDVLGSALEFEERKYENINDINLYNENNHFTDDTVLTLAVADWLLNNIDKCYLDDVSLKEALGRRFVKWTKRYRFKELGYGNSYIQWFFRAELVNEYKKELGEQLKYSSQISKKIECLEIELAEIFDRISRKN